MGGLGDSRFPAMYGSYAQIPFFDMGLVIRTPLPRNRYRGRTRCDLGVGAGYTRSRVGNDGDNPGGHADDTAGADRGIGHLRRCRTAAGTCRPLRRVGAERGGASPRDRRARRWAPNLATSPGWCWARPGLWPAGSASASSGRSPRLACWSTCCSGSNPRTRHTCWSVSCSLPSPSSRVAAGVARGPLDPIAVLQAE